MRVLVTGAHGPLGQRVCRLALADGRVHQLLRLDSIPSTDPGELKARLEGIDTIVHLGASTGPALDGTGAAGVDVEGTRALLEAAGALGVQTVVLLSTAMVYGAWADNPVPLTEDAPLRPNSDFAAAKAEVERLAHEWRADHPNATVAILRPAVAVSEETSGWMSSSLWLSRSTIPEDLAPPVQFVHLDDLAEAVDLARIRRLDGAFNVAPDGWIPPEQLQDLSGPAPRLRLPASVASRLARLRWRFGLTSTPPEVLPYTLHPWVVANDRLRAAGWEPRSSNEEAFVVGVKAGALAEMNPRRRQALALAGMGAAVGAVGAGAVLAAHRWRRKALASG